MTDLCQRLGLPEIAPLHEQPLAAAAGPPHRHGGLRRHQRRQQRDV